MEQQLTDMASSFLTYTYQEMVINIAMATILGLIVSLTYKHTHKGLSYSQSFTQTIVFVSVIVAIIMMVIGASLARAFALVGALSIIRFRTVVKDTKDMVFVFGALAVGMASGTSNYFLAMIGAASVCVLAISLYKLNFGAMYKSEFILRFTFDKSQDSQSYLDVIQKHARRWNLLHMEPSADGLSLRITYDIVLFEEFTAEALTAALSHVDAVREVVLIAAKSDVDY